MADRYSDRSPTFNAFGVAIYCKDDDDTVKHRDDGPAFMDGNYERFYWEGVWLPVHKWLEVNTSMSFEDKVMFKLRFL